MLREIPTKYSVVLHLFYKEEKSYAEISAIMKMPMNSVKSLIHRGKGLIKLRLNQDHQLQLHTGNPAPGMKKINPLRS
ncbi:MAG: hypothetical protein GY940_12245 [bacterium]|nr:hypothetical protein [bacterium]